MHNFIALQEVFGKYLADQQILKEPKALYEPFQYIMQMGGKRMRPVMCLMACQCFDLDVTKALPAALSVEIFHNFSLVHDDIMDEAAQRRGRPTVHTKYGLNSGILVGDVMLIHAYDHLKHSPLKSAIGDMVNTLSKVAIKVCEGQQYDVDFERRNDVTIEEYLLMIEMKTAALLAGSLELGALAAGAPAKDVEHLSEFGRLTGIAFQIQDDFLDAFGDGKKVGKRIGGDIINNKKTCLYIKALELADAPTRAQLLHYYSTDYDQSVDEKVTAVLAIFKVLGIPDYLRSLRNSYQEKAYQHLQAVSALPDAKEQLQQMAEMLLVREL